jgi:hypothetical protein
MLTASTAVLDYAARYKSELLYNRYQAGRDAIRRYGAEPPFAYFIPQAQRDPVAPVELLRRLAFNGVRVFQLTKAVTVDNQTHAAGTWVIPMNQEFGELARQVLEPQRYPDLREYPEGPPELPYDAAGWTLPYQMDVRVIAASSPLGDEARAALKPLDAPAADWKADEADRAPFDSVPGAGFDTDPNAAGVVPAPAKAAGAGPALAVDAAQNNAFRAVNQAWRAGGGVHVDARGRYILTGVAPGTLAQWVERLALRAEWVAGPSGPKLVKPRLALYRPWTASMDEGWTRWLLEMYGFDFSPLYNVEVQAGALRDRFDVIVLSDERARTITDGFQPGSVPPRYEGGIGDRGVRALDEFVRKGGTLVCLNNSALFAIDAFRLPVRNVVAGLTRQQFFAGGSIFEITPDVAHPVMAGLPDRAPVFVFNSPAFATAPGFEGTVLAKYRAAGSPLLSGYLLGEKYLNGAAAAVDARHGDGHVVLIGFKPQWRGQPFGSFKVLFNAALFHGELAAKAAGTKGFWTPPQAPEPEKK